MFLIQLINGKQIEVTEAQFKGLVVAVFTGEYKDKTDKISRFIKNRQGTLTGWEKYQRARQELKRLTYS